jgi:2-polyprenyl-3-methyl-5-hydroxy-6-metoxy-1,4-benzoquinol methylase
MGNPIVHALTRVRKRLVKRTRGVKTKLTRLRMPPLWLRLANEVAACPACASPGLSILDVLRVRREMTGRRVSFLTGCRSCGLLFINPLPPPERIEQFYTEEGAWGREHSDRRQRLLAAHERRQGRPKQGKEKPRKRVVVLEALEPHVPVTAPPPGARVLDFGCGEGKLLDWLQPFGWETYGIEPSTSIASLRHHFLHKVPQDASFDFAVLHHVLEHVTNPLDVLTQLAGAVRPDGLLFVSVPRFDTVAEHGDFRYCINGRNHLLCFTEACLRTLLARAGFEVVATFHAREIDQAVTDGEPLRMRILARRSPAPPAPPAAPLRAARRALAAYARRRLPIGERVALALSPRLRGPWIERSMS